MIGIEGLGDADLAEHLAGAADLPGLWILEDEHVEIADLGVLVAGEALLRPVELADERLPIGREIGEAAARQFRHLVNGPEILAGRRSYAVAHGACPISRRMVSADNAARSARLSVIRNSSMLWILPPRTPIVSTTGTPQAAILLPSQTPPEGFHAIAWPRSEPAFLTRLNRASASAVSGFGGRANPPLRLISTSRSAPTARRAGGDADFPPRVNGVSGVRGGDVRGPHNPAAEVDLDIPLGRDGEDRLVDLPLGRCLDFGRAGP